MINKLLAALAVALSIQAAAAVAHADDKADPRWYANATPACQKACKAQGKKFSKVVPDTTVIDVEKCDRVECDCGGAKAFTDLPDGAFCQRYMIVTPPPKPVVGKCRAAHCQT